MIELVLPYPISVNRYWVNRIAKVKHGPRAGESYMARMGSKEGLAYKAEVQRIALEQRVKPIIGPVEYDFELYPQRPKDWERRARKDPVWWDLTVQCMDLDNARKVLLDALNGVAWTDDSRIRRDPGEIMIPDGEARCVIRIRPYVRQHPQTSLLEAAA